MIKLGARDRAQLVVFAYQTGLGQRAHAWIRSDISEESLAHRLQEEGLEVCRLMTPGA
jgi:hypothetical protein